MSQMSQEDKEQARAVLGCVLLITILATIFCATAILVAWIIWGG